MAAGTSEHVQGELVESIVKIKRCAAVVKGGRRFSFAAMVVVGDGGGKAGWGYGKANEVPPSVEKARKEAMRSMVDVPLEGSTVPHVVEGTHGAAHVILVPASPGTGVIAGSAVRAVCDAYRQSWHDLSPELQALVDSGVHPFQDKWVRRVSPSWRREIPRPGEPCCIVSSSGMLNGGPSVGYAQQVLDQERNAIIFPGYTDEESPGRKLQELKAGDSIRLQGIAQVQKPGLPA